MPTKPESCSPEISLEDMLAIKSAMQADVGKVAEAVRNVTEVGEYLNGILANQQAHISAQQLAIVGLGAILLKHTGYSGQNVYDMLVKSEGYTSEDAVDQILRATLSAVHRRKRPELTVVSSPTHD